MARGNGTGPMGQGPLTGRGMGTCAGEITRRPYGNRSIGYNRGGGGFVGRGGFGGRGAGFGNGMRGRALGCRPGFEGNYVEEPINTMSDKEWLNEERAALEDRLNLVKKELDNLTDE